jgi:hypothetical protein
MSTLIPRFLIAMSFVACSRSRAPQALAGDQATVHSGAANADTRDGPRAPMTVAIDVMKGSPSAGATLALRAHVLHVSTWTAPIDLEINLPRGVSLTRGAQRFTVTPSSGRGAEQIDFEIQLSAVVPLTDLVVVAAHQSRGAGVHAEARYRFGRAAPLPHAPARSGPELTTKKAKLGRAVPL